MSNLIESLIRTYVPLAVGALASYLVVKYGIVVPEDITLAATVALTGAIQAAYYGAVRLLERRWPAAGVLLGKASQPDYNAA